MQRAVTTTVESYNRPVLTVKLVPASAKLPIRYVARMGKAASFVTADDYVSDAEAIDACAMKLAKRLKIKGDYFSGKLDDGRIVFVDSINPITF